MIKINEDTCIQCSACIFACPEGFEMVDGVVRIKNAKAKDINEAISVCPVGALSNGSGK